MRSKSNMKVIKGFGQIFTIPNVIRSNWEYQDFLDERTPRALTSFHHLAGLEFFNFLTEPTQYYSINYACIFGRAHVNKYGGRCIKLRRETL